MRKNKAQREEEIPYLYLRTRNSLVLSAWKRYFTGYRDCDIQNSNILQIAADAIVSPANSFGTMGAGIDRLYRNYFGPSIEERVQKEIKDSSGGKLPIGQALIVSTNNSHIPFLIVSPTMETPRDIRGTDNVYKAMSAVLTAVSGYNSLYDKPIIKSVLVPGMGTGYGRMDPFESASQMWRAVQERTEKEIYK